MDMNSRNPFRRKAGYAVIPLAGWLLLSACSALPKGELTLDLGIKDRGVASWYGKEFHGKLAANGEAFDMTAYTAAHRKLPLGSVVRVVNLTNGKTVQVRINDRGPYVAGRMLDLSHAAARELGMDPRGSADREASSGRRGPARQPYRQSAGGRTCPETSRPAGALWPRGSRG